MSPFCRDVIKARIQDQLADPGPILEDIKQVSAGDLGDDIDGFLAGFPCQDKSEDVQPIKKNEATLSTMQPLLDVLLLVRTSPPQGTRTACKGRGPF